MHTSLQFYNLDLNIIMYKPNFWRQKVILNLYIILLSLRLIKFKISVSERNIF